MVAIEKGERRIRIEELQPLANRYGVSVNALLRREAVHVDLIPRFRRLQESEEPEVAEAVRLMNDLVSAEVELEKTLGIDHGREYPPEKFIEPGQGVIAQAEAHADWLRAYLGLGPGPIADIFTLIQFSLGIRLFQKRLHSKVSGLFAYDPQVGATMLLNANHRWDRRVQSAAHELGHFIGTRQMPEVLEKNERFRSREERYADAFGRAFLTPAREVMRRFKQLTEADTHVKRSHIILMAHHFGVSREAMVRRLEELGSVRKGTWEWFKDRGGITDADAERVLGTAYNRYDAAKDEADQLVPPRMGLMAYQAWSRELLSEGQLSKLLKLSRIELRQYLHTLEQEEGEADDLLKLPH